MPPTNLSDSPLVVGLDLDDTIFENEDLYRDAERAVAALVVDWIERDAFRARLVEIERVNVPLYGYGVTGYLLSLIETAVDVTNGGIDARSLGRIMELGRPMLTEQPGLLDGAADAVVALASLAPIVAVTKGDLLHQESKIARCELAHHFTAAHVVAEKDPATYTRVLDDHSIDPAHFVMIGNSIRSDIVPVLEIGGSGIHVPFRVTWELEETDAPLSERAHEATTLDEAVEIVASMR